MAGVVVAVATVPAQPFGLTTETLVTVPVPPVEEIVMFCPKGVSAIPLPAEIVTSPVRALKEETPALGPSGSGSLTNWLDIAQIPLQLSVELVIIAVLTPPLPDRKSVV